MIRTNGCKAARINYTGKPLTQNATGTCQYT